MAKSKSPTPAKLPRKTVTDATDKATLKCLEGEARSVYEDSIKDGKPELAAPVRSLGNVKYDSKVGPAATATRPGMSHTRHPQQPGSRNP